MKLITTIIFIIIFLTNCQIDTSQEPVLKVEKEEKIKLIDQYVTQLAKQDHFSGNILVAKNGLIHLKKAFGYAHLGFKIKNTVDTKFNYASIGKSFTAILIFQLLEKGQLSLSDTLGKYLPDYPNKTIREQVTIKQLLTHRSGVPNIFGNETYLKSSKSQYRSLHDFATIYEQSPMESLPNKQFSYRNTNYILLGRIIEKIVNKPYNEHLQTAILDPLKMSNTGNFDQDHVIPNMAEGYTLSGLHPNKYQLNTFMGTVKGNSAGGGYTTLEDLFLFTKALKNYSLLDSTQTALFTHPMDSVSHYGYGMQFPYPNTANIYGHSGGHFGIGAEWSIYRKEGYTIILLTNRDVDQGFLEMRFYIQQLLSGATPSLQAYFFTKKIIATYLGLGYDKALELIHSDLSKVSEAGLNAKGYEYIKRGQLKKAIDLFKLECTAFPTSSNAFDSLGEAYLKNDNLTLALINYQKSLSLDPTNKHAETIVIQLKRGAPLTSE